MNRNFIADVFDLGLILFWIVFVLGTCQHTISTEPRLDALERFQAELCAQPGVTCETCRYFESTRRTETQGGGPCRLMQSH